MNLMRTTPTTKEKYNYKIMTVSEIAHLMAAILTCQNRVNTGENNNKTKDYGVQPHTGK